MPATKYYLYTATDCEGKTHSFEADSPTADLSPIWREIPTGLVTLKVEAANKRTGELYTAGVRTFYKASPFPGRAAYGGRARSYRECALLAFRYVFSDKTNQYWLTHGTPDPEYYHNVYPSKTIESIVKAMLAYAELEPVHAEEAVQLAKNAADYLLSITYGDGSLLKGLPPTYSFLGLNKTIVDANAPAAYGRRDTVMTIYPAMVGSTLLKLEKATGEEKYFLAAKDIAAYYKANVLPNGSWYLLVNEKTGKPEGSNCCLNFSLLSFFHAFHRRTGEECWRTLEENYYRYLVKNCLEQYNWEGQFEDIALSGNYANLTHLTADSMIGYITENLSNDPDMLAEAEELMRYVEDQFVVWGKHAPWLPHLSEESHYPAGLEQYAWYVPIDGSTVAIMRAFLDLYAVKRDPLLLEKALTLGDAITRMQNPETGVIPTHWMQKDCTYNLTNFWINCHTGSAFQMLHLAKTMGEL
ncbi:MAG: hypothetical protein J6W31_04895 [Clostridia bacterium]|nr:hypothetical protein [Clostridia bacterium]